MKNIGENRESIFDVDSSLVAVAHELKSPLALIRQLSLFLENEQEIDRDYLRQITLTSERAIRIANDLSKVSRLEQLELDLEPINPSEVCKQVVYELADYYELYNKTISVSGKQKANYLAVANYDLLRSILIQFCDNALHYADQNRPVELEINKLAKKNVVRISVRDFGPRLPLQVWRGFKKRTEVIPQKLSSRPLSSGIGLYLASQFATAMNANIGTVSHADGATFYIDLEISKQLSLL